MKEKFCNYDEFSGLVSEICRQISLDKWRPDYIVGIIRGGLFPAVMISHYLDVPCYTLKVSIREHKETESNLWMAEDVSLGKKILIVDDINDSGDTINWILNDWNLEEKPDNVRFAVVMDNLKSKSRIKVDYHGIEIDKEETGWIIFPYEKWWV